MSFSGWLSLYIRQPETEYAEYTASDTGFLITVSRRCRFIADLLRQLLNSQPPPSQSISPPPAAAIDRINEYFTVE